MHYARAPYLWVMYKQMCHFGPDDLVFVCPSDYLLPPEVHLAQGRGDIGRVHQAQSAFSLPTVEQLRSYRAIQLPDIAIDPASRINAFREQLTQLIPVLIQQLREAFVQLDTQEPIEAILCWCNCPSLDHVAKSLGIPVIYNELGALRGPEYHWTAYFDFRGVNGGTEADERFAHLQAESIPESMTYDREQLRALLAASDNKPPMDDPKTKFDAGVALQVGIDSNIVAFNREWTMTKLCREAGRRWPMLLVRPHPQGNHDVAEVDATLDDSLLVSHFLERCKRLLTINSSVALEAMLAGIPSYVLGDAPTAFAARKSLDDDRDPLSNADMCLALNFLVLGYLIPYELLFDAAYYRWRLTHPRELEILNCHQSYWIYRQSHASKIPAPVFPYGACMLSTMLRGLVESQQRQSLRLSQMAVTQDKLLQEQFRLRTRIDTYEQSWSWRLTSPFRYLQQRMLFQSKPREK